MKSKMTNNNTDVDIDIEKKIQQKKAHQNVRFQKVFDDICRDFENKLLNDLPLKGKVQWENVNTFTMGRKLELKYTSVKIFFVHDINNSVFFTKKKYIYWEASV